MRLNKLYKIEEGASTDPHRPVLNYAVFENGRLETCDGHILVNVPCEGPDDAKAVLVNTKAVKDSRKGTPKRDDMGSEFTPTQAKGGALHAIPEDLPPYPNTRQIYPRNEGRTIKIALNAELLACVQRGIGAESVVLTIDVDKDGDSTLNPYKVTPNVTKIKDKSAWGIIMPCRI